MNFNQLPEQAKKHLADHNMEAEETFWSMRDWQKSKEQECGSMCHECDEIERLLTKPETASDISDSVFGAIFKDVHRP